MGFYTDLNTEMRDDGVTGWRMLSALGLGAALGGALVLCDRWMQNSPMLCLAFQSVFSTAGFVVLASARSRGLNLRLG